MSISTHGLSPGHTETPTGGEPVDILISEHRMTEQVLNCLERMAERWAGPESPEQLDAQAIRKAIAFFQTFVEAWHFRREEAYFAATGVRVEGMGFDESGAWRFHDHEHCSMHLRGIEEAVGVIASRSLANNLGDSEPAQPPSEGSGSGALLSEEVAAAYRRFGKHAWAYSDILLKHIEHEEDCIYPAIEGQLSPQTRRAATEAFRRASRESIGAQKLQECREMVGELTERFRVAPR